MPRPVRAGPGGAGDGRGRASPRERRARARRRRATCSPRSRGDAVPGGRSTPPCRRPATRRCACCAASACVDPTSLDDYRAARRLRGPAPRPSSSGPPASSARSPTPAGRAAAAPPSPPAASGRRSRASPTRPHYLVCNADESEPGTFKDRVVMEGDPFALIEAMTIAGYATGVRARLPLPARRVPDGALQRSAHAIDQARARGLLGDDVLGQGFAFDIEIRAAPAPTSAARRPRSSTRSRATAASRATSRRSPSRRACSASRPWSTTSRRWSTCCRSCSTAAAAYAAIGTEALDGHQALLRLGQRRAARRLRAAVRRDAAASCSTSRAACPTGARCRRCCSAARPAASSAPTSSTSRSPSRARARGGHDARLGRRAGLDDTVDLPRMLLRIAAFFRDESCGQCVPCRVGTVRQEEALHRHRRPARAAASAASSRCSARSASACATPRSAVSARPRRAPSSPPSTGWGCSEVTA